MSSTKIINTDLASLVFKSLEHMSPQTREKSFLNKMTESQIRDFSYRVNMLPRDAIDGNCLVPKSQHQHFINRSWRYPWSLTTRFLVAPDKGNGKISINIFFGVPRLIYYKERRKGNLRPISNREINAPDDFFKIKACDEEFNLMVGNKVKERSYFPVFFECLIEVDLTESQKIYDIAPQEIDEKYIKIYYENSGNITEATFNGIEPTNSATLNKNDRNSRIGVLAIGAGSPSMKLKFDSKWRKDVNAYEITLKIMNESQSSSYTRHAKALLDTGYTTFPSTLIFCSYTRHAKALLDTAIFPHMYIEANSGKLIYPKQQHYDCLISSLMNKNSKEMEAIIETYTYQTNCITTKSTIKDNLLTVTPFGVFDTIRINPKTGPQIKLLYENIDEFIKIGSELSEKTKEKLRDPKISHIVTNVMKAASQAFNIEETQSQAIYKYQWVAIQRRINKIFDKDKSKAVVIRAPTGAGKTLPFMVNSVLHYLLTGERAVLVFPTRILNEDMFKRLTRLMFALSKFLPESNCTGGIFIGTKDPAYQALTWPEIGQIMVQYDTCPSCDKKGSVVAKKKGERIIGVCNSCGHEIDYMYPPLEVTDYLPAITIATPDKLFYELTYNKWSDYTLRFIGAPVVKCRCGHHQSLMGKKGQRLESIECDKCGASLKTSDVQRFPVGYFVFDEVHSLYGLSATLVSLFMNLIQKMMEYLGNIESNIAYETGTATIANEEQLLSAITHRKIEQFPDKKDFMDYFDIDSESVRYRTNIVLPVGRATMFSVLRAVLHTFECFHKNKKMREVVNTSELGFNGDEYNLLLTYLLMKKEGYSLLKALKDHAGSRGYQLRTDFLSGEFSTVQMVRVLEKLFQGGYEVILANMVISLGVDIHKLNNMIMMGVPKSVTEMIQTIGRTGRKQGVPGYITIHCLPSIPRDMFVYKSFHSMMSDVEGYFDTKPIQGTNAYAAEIILPNVVKGLMSAKKSENYLLGMTKFAGAAFVNNTELRRLYLDVMKVLVPIEEVDKFRDLRGYIGNNKVVPVLKEYATEWSGTNTFLSEWFETHGRLLYGLRDQSEQVGIEILEGSLLNKVAEQYQLNDNYFDETLKTSVEVDEEEEE